MNKIFVYFFVSLFCLGIVFALPVTYKGNISIDNATGNGVELKVVSSLEEVTTTVNGSYVINIAGEEGKNTSFYIWGKLVDKVIQPVQTSVVEYNLFFNKSANGESCSFDNACINGICVNKEVVGVCSSENYYCDNDGLCDVDYGETTTNCGGDCRRTTSSSGGGSYTNYGSKTIIEDTSTKQSLIDTFVQDGNPDDYRVVAVGDVPNTKSTESVDSLNKVLSELSVPGNGRQTQEMLSSSGELTVTKGVQKYEIKNKQTGKTTKKTRVTLSVTSKKDGQTIVIVEVVPKGVANSADLLEFFGVTPEVLESDPIVQWTFTDTKAGDVYNVDYAIEGSLNSVASTSYGIETDNIVVEEEPEVIVDEPTTEPEIVGNDTDEHGCIGSAGYTWCEIKQKCLREFEEPCEEIKGEVTSEVVNPAPEQGDNKFIVLGVIFVIIILVILWSYFNKKKAKLMAEVEE